MILTLDRPNNTLCGGGVVASVDAESSVLAAWCRAAVAEGYDLAGMALDVWDAGADERRGPLFVMAVTDAWRVLHPDRKKKGVGK